MKRILFFASLLIVGCSGKEQAEVACTVPSLDFTTLFEAEYAAPFREGRADDWIKIFDADAVAMHNRRPADVGRDSIGEFGHLVSATFKFAEYAPRIVDTKVGCGWAMSRGEYRSSLVFRESGEPAPWGPEEGKFLIIWEEQSDGTWKIVADMGNSNG